MQLTVEISFCLVLFTFQFFVLRGRAGSVRGSWREVSQRVEKSAHSPIRNAAVSSSSSLSPEPALVVVARSAAAFQPFSWFIIRRPHAHFHGTVLASHHALRTFCRARRIFITCLKSRWSNVYQERETSSKNNVAVGVARYSISREVSPR